MKIEKRRKEFIDYGKSRRGADVYYRDSWECDYFSLLGKCFGMMGMEFITLKGIPEENAKLREKYKDVIPGYYANKEHWISVYLKTDELTEEEIKQLIDTSYQLVYQKLTKKEKLIIDEMNGKQ